MHKLEYIMQSTCPGVSHAEIILKGGFINIRIQVLRPLHSICAFGFSLLGKVFEIVTLYFKKYFV